MNEPVLDCSALLALLLREPGAERVEAVLPTACMSSVNLAEALAKMTEWGITLENAQNAISGLGIEIVDFDAVQAARSAGLRRQTRDAGLSLGDRACLALALHRQTTVMTTDKAWLRLDGLGLPKIICIRSVSS